MDIQLLFSVSVAKITNKRQEHPDITVETGREWGDVSDKLNH